MCINLTLTLAGIIRVKTRVRLLWPHEAFVLFLDEFSPWHAILRDGGYVGRKRSTYRDPMTMV